MPTTIGILTLMSKKKIHAQGIVDDMINLINDDDRGKMITYKLCIDGKKVMSVLKIKA